MSPFSCPTVILPDKTAALSPRHRATSAPRRSTTIRAHRLSRSAVSGPPAAPPRPLVARPLPSNARPTAAAQLSPALDCLIVGLALALFIGVAAYHWRLPGLYNDEAYDVVPAMQLVLGQPVALNRGVGLHLFGRDFPLMISDYQGVSSMYVVLPLFALFGPGVGPVRAMTIGFGVVAIALTYLLGRRLFGRPAGLVAALLLASNPSFIFWSRIGVYVVSQVVPLALGASLAWLAWRRGGRAGWLLLAGLLAGIGLSTKILFIWFILAALSGGIAVWLVEWWWPLDTAGRGRRRRPLRAKLAERPTYGVRDLLAGGLGLLLGAAPLIAYNLASAGTFKILRANLGQTEKGVDNTAFLTNLTGRFAAFKTVLEGSYFWFLGDINANRLALPLFLVSAIGLMALVCLVPGYRRFRAATVFILILILAILVQSAFTLSGLEATHLLLLLPFPLLISGAFAWLAGDWLLGAVRGLRGCPGARAAVAALPALALTILLVAGNLLVSANYHRLLTETGGKSSFSDRIYELARFLDKPQLDIFDYKQPIALDWGMKYSVQLLTAGRVDPQEIYGQGATLPPDYLATLDRLFADPTNVYLAHRADGDNPPAAYPDRTKVFLEHAAARGKKVVPVKIIYEPEGVPLFYLYTVRDP